MFAACGRVPSKRFLLALFAICHSEFVHHSSACKIAQFHSTRINGMEALQPLPRSATFTYDFLATPQHSQLAETHMKRRTNETAIGLFHNNHIDCTSQRCTIYFIVKLFERFQQTIHGLLVSFCFLLFLCYLCYCGCLKYVRC